MTPTPKFAWRRRLKPNAEIQVVVWIAHDGALVASYHPSCIETYTKVIDL